MSSILELMPALRTGNLSFRVSLANVFDTVFVSPLDLSLRDRGQTFAGFNDLFF